MPRYLDETQYGMDAGRLGEQQDEPEDVTCNRCGEGDLHWQRVTAPDGRSERSVLMNERMQRHVCKPSADDFEVVS